MTERDSIAVTGNLSRRRLLQGGALVGIGAFIAACRPAGGAASPSAAASAAPTEAPSAGGSPAASGAASAAPLGGKLNFANWTAYIDLTVTPGNDGVEGTERRRLLAALADPRPVHRCDRDRGQLQRGDQLEPGLLQHGPGRVR